MGEKNARYKLGSVSGSHLTKAINSTRVRETEKTWKSVMQEKENFQI